MESVKSDELIEEGFKYCKEFLGGSWAKASEEHFSMTQITGGLSNTLYKCSLKDHHPIMKKEQRHVLLRIYGEIIFENSDTVLNDSVTFTLLAERNLGPKLYGIFSRGRIEEYVPSRVLTTSELHLPVISKACARIMCRFHQLNMPMNKQPRWLFDVIQRYLNDALKLAADNQFSPSLDLTEEYNQLKVLLASIKSPVIFCHNDMQEGNILFIGEHLMKNGDASSEDKVVLNGHDEEHHYNQHNDILRPIDFEYSSYNYRGFDIGNHFCEWCYSYQNPYAPYFNADLSAYPDKQQQLTFVREYIREKKLLKESNEELDGDDGEDYIEEEEEEEDEDGLLLEANGFALASHFLWYLWSVVQSKKSTIKFGYMEYAEERLHAYQCQKPEVLQMLHEYKRNKAP